MRMLAPLALSLWLVSSSMAAEPLDIRSIRNCTAQQEDSLRNAEAGILARLQDLRSELSRYDLKYVYEQFVLPMKREWQEGSARNQAYTHYLSRMDAAFARMEQDSRSGLVMECKDSKRERQCQNGEVFAYVLFWFGKPQKTLYFCTSYFDQDPRQQRQTLFHELSHYSASTDDLAGSWMNGVNTDIRQAPNDAYHLEQYADGDVLQTVRRQIWFWNWPKRN